MEGSPNVPKSSVENIPQGEESRLRIAFYNVENLFDCIPDTLYNDEEFLPEGIRHWTSWRYWQKLLHIGQVLTSMGESNAPELVGLCEVENDSVMDALTRRSLLRSVGYRYVMTESNDPRGIDVSLLYRPSHFHLLSVEQREVPVQILSKGAHARNVLHVNGELVNGDTLDVIVCHWPSQLGGKRYSEPLRMLAADVVLAISDSLSAIREKANIVVMGDFNENPRGRAVNKLENGGFCNLTRFLSGSYRYKGQWEQLDQMLVSSMLLLSNASLRVVSKSIDGALSAQLFNADFLLENEPIYGGKRPFRTFSGRRYKGGYSDHLPVFIDLSVRLY